MNIRFVSSFSPIVRDVAAAAAELQAAGYELVHETRIEPWGQTIARVLDPNGLIVGLSFTPWMREGLK